MDRHVHLAELADPIVERGGGGRGGAIASVLALEAVDVGGARLRSGQRAIVRLVGL